MVSDKKVNNDINALASLFSNYNSTFNSMSTSWSGLSYNSLERQARDFSEDYYSGIKKQMESFGTACELYSTYVIIKKNKKIAESNYNEALSRKDNSKANEFKKQVTKFSEELNDYKRRIESALLTASSIKLDATNYYGSSGISSPTTKQTTPETTPKTSPATTPAKTSGSSKKPSKSAQEVIKAAIAFGVSVANDNSHGYSRKTRWGNPNYDCSSLVISCFEAAGVPVKENGASYTGNMRRAFEKCGFIWIAGNPSLSSLQPGDVVLKAGKHVELYIGDGMNVGAHKDFDGKNGDSSGKEINVCKYRNFPWDGVLRYVGNK